MVGTGNRQVRGRTTSAQGGRARVDGNVGQLRVTTDAGSEASEAEGFGHSPLHPTRALPGHRLRRGGCWPPGAAPGSEDDGGCWLPGLQTPELKMPRDGMPARHRSTSPLTASASRLAFTCPLPRRTLPVRPDLAGYLRLKAAVLASDAWQPARRCFCRPLRACRPTGRTGGWRSIETMPRRHWKQVPAAAMFKRVGARLFQPSRGSSCNIDSLPSWHPPP